MFWAAIRSVTFRHERSVVFRSRDKLIVNKEDSGFVSHISFLMWSFTGGGMISPFLRSCNRSSCTSARSRLRSIELS